MIFGPKKELKEKVKKTALNSDKVSDEQIKTAMKISKILSTVKTVKDSKSEKSKSMERDHFERVQINKEKTQKENVKKEALRIADTFFSIGSRTVLKLMRLETFTTRELLEELKETSNIQSLKEVRKIINTTKEIGIIKKGETKFGEQAFVMDFERLREIIREIKKGLNYLSRETR